MVYNLYGLIPDEIAIIQNPRLKKPHFQNPDY
jgi:hypothetical protein